MGRQIQPLFGVVATAALAVCLVGAARAAENTQERIEALRWIIAHNVEDPAFSRAEIHEALGHFLLGAQVEVTKEVANEAEHHLRRAVELDPTLYWGWYDLAIMHMDTEEGNQYLKNAIAANPEFPEPYYWLGYTHARNGRDVEAMSVFKQYLQVVRDHPDAVGRMELAEDLLAELRSGVDGEELRRVRKRSGTTAEWLE